MHQPATDLTVDRSKLPGPVPSFPPAAVGADDVEETLARQGSLGGYAPKDMAERED